jgi:hypothetical protein
LLLDDVEILYSYSTPVAAMLEDGSFIRSKNYYKGSTSPTTQKHITQTLNYWCLEYGLKPEQLASGAELVDQSEIENLIPCVIK